MSRKIAVDSRAVPYSTDHYADATFTVEPCNTGYVLYARKGLRVFSLIDNYVMIYKQGVGFAYFKMVADIEHVMVLSVVSNDLPKDQAEKACKIIDAIQLLSSEEFM